MEHLDEVCMQPRTFDHRYVNELYYRPCICGGMEINQNVRLKGGRDYY